MDWDLLKGFSNGLHLVYCAGVLLGLVFFIALYILADKQADNTLGMEETLSISSLKLPWTKRVTSAKIVP